MIIPSPTKKYHKKVYPAIDPSSPHLSTKGKSVFITGGGYGIGAEIARGFAKSGSSNIAILGRTEACLLETKKAIESEHKDTQVVIYIADVTSREAVESALSAFHAVAGPVRILVSNAGYVSGFESISKSDPEKWWQSFNVHVQANYNLIRSFEKVATEDATVINLSSASLQSTTPGLSSYVASKIATSKFFEYLAQEHTSWAVFNLHPGLIPTGMGTLIQGIEHDDIDLPAAFCVWLTSVEAKFLSGRFLWANWDVEELKGLKEEIVQQNRFTLGLVGWP